jgi:hypothetical protein
MKTCPRCNAPQDTENNESCQYCGLDFRVDFQNPIKPKSRLIELILGWSFGIMFLLTGMSFGILFLLFTESVELSFLLRSEFGFLNYLIIALIFIGMSLILIPPIINQLEDSFNFHLPNIMKILIVITCLLFVAIVSPDKVDIPKELKTEDKVIEHDKMREKNIDCWKAGYRIGYCATISYYEYECAPEDDIVKPRKCSSGIDNRAYEMGFKRGIEAANKRLGLKD